MSWKKKFSSFTQAISNPVQTVTNFVDRVTSATPSELAQKALGSTVLGGLSNAIEKTAGSYEAPGGPTADQIAGEDQAFGQMREAGRSAIGGKYGALRNELQTSMTSRGLGRSGFLGSGLTGLEGQEKMEIAGLDADLAAKRAGIDTGNWNLAMQQSQQDWEQKQAAANRKFGILATALGGAGKLLGAA